MIHQVSRLPQDDKYLTDILALQVAVLKAARNIPDIDIFDHATGNSNFQLILENQLAQERRFRDRREEVARWITRKSATLLKPLSRFARGSQQDKDDFVQGVISDLNLLFRPHAASLSIFVLDNAGDWQKGARDFLYVFYDLWKDPGFDKILFSRSMAGEKYSRLDFIAEFEKENPGIYVCAICDGSGYKTKTESRVYTSVEHYLPRSIYPHFSCHPRNLIPICSFCNSYIKGDNDPLLRDQQRIGISELPLPYQQDALKDKAWVAYLQRNPYNKAEHPHPYRLELRSARNVDNLSLIISLNHLYKVDERWSGVLEQIEEQAFRRLFQFLTLSSLGGQALTPTNLSSQLRTLMAITDLENVGKDPYAFPMVWLLKAFRDQLEQEKDQSSVYKSIRDWGQEIHQRWIEIQDRADELHNRVP